jgi:hypothetical protein
LLNLSLCGTTFRTISELKTVSTTLKVWFSPGMAQYVVVLHADNIFSFLFYFTKSWRHTGTNLLTILYVSKAIVLIRLICKEGTRAFSRRLIYELV